VLTADRLFILDADGVSVANVGGVFCCGIVEIEPKTVGLVGVGLRNPELDANEVSVVRSLLVEVN
jgi:hypothetical protein